MTDSNVEQVLRRAYTAEVGESVRAPTELRARVAAIPDTAPRARAFGRNRPLVLIAAVLMLSTLLLSAIAAGSGLLRLPTAVVAPTPSTPSRATPQVALTVEDEPLGDCDRSIDDGVVLELTPTPDNMGNELPPGATGLVVLDDGRVVTGRARPMDLDDEWRQRQLTRSGVEAVLNSISAASLPNCGAVYAGAISPNHQLTARIGGGLLSVRSSDTGLRRVTTQQQVAVRELFERLIDLDAWTTPDMWAETDWRPYTPDRWELKVGFEIFNVNPCGPATALGQNCRPSGYLLPEGSDLTSFGTPDLDSDTGSAPRVRCGLIDRSDAEAIVENLRLRATEDDPFGSHDAYSRSLPVGPSPVAIPGLPLTDDSFAVGISLRGLLPHQPACALSPRAADEPPDALPDLNPCRYVPRSAWGALDLVPWCRGYSPSGATSMNGVWSGSYFESNSGTLLVHLRVRPTTIEQADSYARSLFGDVGSTSETVAGGTIHLNGCFEPEARCRPAVVVSADGFMLVLTGLGDFSSSDLRSLAEAVIREGLPGDQPTATP